MRYLFCAMLAALSLIAFSVQSQAAPKGKTKSPQQVQKERLVLLPMDISEENRAMYGQQESAVVAGLAQKYEVFSGDRVIQELRKASSKENARAKGHCDETRCLEDVAIALQTENVAMVHVTKMEGGYLLSISIKNVMTNQAVFDNSLPCEGCNIFKVIDKLKELVGTPAAVSTASAEEEPPAKVNLSDPETALWEEAKKGNTAEDYQAYLSTYPKGKYAPLAKTKLARMKNEAKAIAEQQEQQAWSDAQQSASQESYSAYLSVYPKGRFAALAQARINKLQKEETDAEAKQRREQLAEEARQKREAAEAAKKTGQGPAMVKIPGKNYELGKYEVTQKEWREVMGGNPSNFSSCGDTCPVEQVSWDDIQEFLQKLNAKSGRQYRLPTEEEWEYACYGGSQTEYCGSNDIDAVAWYNGNSNSTTHPVGQKQANGYGLYDMSGNVWEWMENEYDAGRRVLRGGSWDYSPAFARSAIRSRNAAAYRSYRCGFRLARTLP